MFPNLILLMYFFFDGSNKYFQTCFTKSMVLHDTNTRLKLMLCHDRMFHMSLFLQNKLLAELAELQGQWSLVQSLATKEVSWKARYNNSKWSSWSHSFSSSVSPSICNSIILIATDTEFAGCYWETLDLRTQ